MGELRTSARSTLHNLGAALLDWRMLLPSALCLVLLFLAAQLPFSYVFQMGLEPGPRGDFAYVRNFNVGELVRWDESWRWTRGQSGFEVPGVGRRNLIVGMWVVSQRSNWQPEAPPQALDVKIGNGTNISIPLRPQRAHYRFYVPATALQDGTLRMTITTTPWTRQEDTRNELGVAIGNLVTLQSVPTPGLVRPDIWPLITWPIGLALFWVALRVLAFSRRAALLLLLPLALALPLIAAFQSPRLSFGGEWAIESGLIGIGAALVCSWLVPPLLVQLNVRPAAPLLRWLLLLVVVSFTVKYGGQLYAIAIPGDLQLHVNRYTRTIFGDIYIMAQHRGLPFPFPNGLYVLMAPLTLTGLDIYFLFELFAGLFESSAILLIYILMARVTGSNRIGLFAAATYGLSAAGFMNTWFSFQTQISTQWFSALLVTLLATRWPRYDDWPIWWLMAMLFIQVFLGHIGSFINTAMLGLLIIPVLWLRAQSDDERRAVRWLLGAGAAAAAFVAIFYYSAVLDTIGEQFTRVAQDGLVELTGRRPIERPAWLAHLWFDGVILHYGFFPILLAVVGALCYGYGRLRRSILIPLIWMTFFVALTQGMIPMITLSSITTRWLTFAGWAVAVGCALGMALLWRRGRSARLLSLIMLAYVSWFSIEVWIEAMALRQRPIEPF